MSGMKSSDSPIILDSQVKIPAFRVRQTDDGSDQVAVAQPAAIALELDRQALVLGDVTGHWSSPLSLSCLPIEDHSSLPSGTLSQRDHATGGHPRGK